jgi:hypothetical protein
MDARRLTIGIRSGAEKPKTLRNAMRSVAQGDLTAQELALCFMTLVLLSLARGNVAAPSIPNPMSHALWAFGLHRRENLKLAPQRQDAVLQISYDLENMGEIMLLARSGRAVHSLS